MKVLTNCLIGLSLLLLISGCAQKERVVVSPTIIKPNIPLVQKPAPLNLHRVKFFVVTEENFEEFRERFAKLNGEVFVYIALSVRDYEKLALNMAEIESYIKKQKEIIIYYEESIKGKEEGSSDDR